MLKNTRKTEKKIFPSFSVHVKCFIIYLETHIETAPLEKKNKKAKKKKGAK